MSRSDIIFKEAYVINIPEFRSYIAAGGFYSVGFQEFKVIAYENEGFTKLHQRQARSFRH